MKPLFGVPSLIYYEIDDYKPNPKPNYDSCQNSTAYSDYHNWQYLDQLKYIRVCTKCNRRQIRICHTDDMFRDITTDLLEVYIRRFLEDNYHTKIEPYKSVLIRNEDFKWPTEK